MDDGGTKASERFVDTNTVATETSSSSADNLEKDFAATIVGTNFYSATTILNEVEIQN